MRHITNVERKKDVYNLTNEEFIKGDWLKLLSLENDILEVHFKNNFLQIISAKIKKEVKSEREGEKNGTKRK